MDRPELLAEIEFRQAVAGDLASLEWEGEFIHFRRLYRQVYKSTTEGKALIWVAELNGVGLIGQAFVQLHSQRRDVADGEARAYVFGFRIKPVYRDSGVGSHLLRRLENDLAQRGFHYVTLNVSRENLDARRLYERRGYRVIGSEPGKWSYLDHLGKRREVHEPAWRMEKKLR